MSCKQLCRKKLKSIPRHSDSELSIDPHSNIYCVSLGETAHIKFETKSNHASDEKMLSVTHRSMYSMIKNSQNHFSHKIEPNSELPDESVRYSITFAGFIGNILTPHMQLGTQTLDGYTLVKERRNERCYSWFT